MGPFPPGLVRSTVLVAQLRSGEVVRSAGWAERCNLTEGSCRYLAWRPRTWGLASSQNRPTSFGEGMCFMVPAHSELKARV